MNGELAQLVCLATYGGRWLAAPDAEPPPDPQRGNSTFQYVSSVAFRGGASWPDVPAWLSGLRDRGARALWLYADAEPDGGDLPPHVAAAFGSGGRWGLVAGTESGQELWRAAWRHTGAESHAAGRAGRPWSVEYLGTDAQVAVPVPPLDGAETALRAALEEAETNAREIGEQQWAEWFADARVATEFRFHPDLVPPDFPAGRRRLAVMAERSFVFGGMGSWNDVAADQAVSARLYGAVLHAFAAAVNA